MAARGSKLVDFNFPLKGYDQGGGVASQRSGTTASVTNVLPFDVVAKRARGGQRAGLSKFLATQICGGGDVQAMLQVTIGAAPAPTAYSEQFTYANGNLTGNGNWLLNGGRVTWTVAGNKVRCGGANTENYNLVALAAVDLSAGYTIEFDLTLANIDLARPTFQLTTEGDNAHPGNYLGTFVFRFDGGTDVGGTNTNVGIETSAAFSQGPAFTCGAGTHHFIITIDSSRTVSILVDGVERFTGVTASFGTATTSVPAYSAANKMLRIWADSSNLGTDIQVDALTVTPAAQARSARQIKVVAAGNGQVWAGDTTSGMTQLATGLSTKQPSLTEFAGKVYYVNGTESKVIDPVAGTIANWTATGGRGTLPAGCTLICTWRGRIILARPEGNPQNVFMSKLGDPLDWLYGQTTADSAFELNAATAGHIGEPVNAVLPFNDDTLLIGTDHSIWLMQGDPAGSSGQLVSVSDAIGMVHPCAWCQSPESVVYFVGSSGLYVIGAGGAPKNLSRTRVNQFFEGIDRGTLNVSCAYDRDRSQVWIFVSKAASAASTHIVYDVRTDSFWPQSFPIAAGPVSTFTYDGDRPQDRATVLGGRDGYMRKLDQSANNDDGTAIGSYVFIGPVQPFGVIDEGMLSQLDVIAGTGTTNLGVQLFKGNSADAALADVASTSLATITAGGRTRAFTRSRANAFYLKFFQGTIDKTWVVEQAQGVFEPGGIQRG
jgi:hypothetical protein